MEDVYCIYSDKLVPYLQTNMEHIIPLSLGGSNKFTLRIDRTINSKLGSNVDGRLVKDYVISSRRRHRDLRGHSKSVPKTSLKKSFIVNTNEPIQINFEGKSGHFYDPIKKKILENKEIVGLQIKSTIKIDPYARPLFVAKTILASGYFIYKDLFKDHADHNSLRKLMNYDPKVTDEPLDNTIEFIDPLFGKEIKSPSIPSMLKTICEEIDSSCVIFLYYQDTIIGTVGIAGTYLGSIRFKADITQFPNSGKYEHGHIIGIQNGELKSNSVRYIVNACFGGNKRNTSNPSAD